MMTSYEEGVEMSQSEANEQNDDVDKPRRKSAAEISLDVAEKKRRSSLAIRISNQKVHKFCCGISMAKNDTMLIKMILAFTFLIFFGGLIFWALESPAEIQRHKDAEALHELQKYKVYELLGNNSQLFNLLGNKDNVETVRGAFSVPQQTYNWEFGSAALFTFTVITTIGYGSFAPETSGGRIFFIFFVMVGVPAAGITLVYVADRALNAVTKCFTMGQDKVKAAFDAFDTDGSGELDLDEFKQAIESLGMNLSDQQFNKLVIEIDADGSGEIDIGEFEEACTQLNADLTEAAGRSNRIKIVIIALFSWIGIGTLTLCLAEEWTFLEGIYFSIVTLTTVGFGDLFPATLGGRIFLIVFAMIGLGILAVMLTLIEGLLDDWEKHKIVIIEKARQAAIKAREMKQKANNLRTSGLRRASSVNSTSDSDEQKKVKKEQEKEKEKQILRGGLETTNPLESKEYNLDFKEVSPWTK